MPPKGKPKAKAEKKDYHTDEGDDVEITKKRKREPKEKEVDEDGGKKAKNDLVANKMPENLDISILKEGQIKIVSFNVLAGINAAIKKGFAKYVIAESPDILALQETKLNQTPAAGFLKDLEAIYPYRYWSHCTKQKGYSGSAVFSKIEPIDVKYGIGDKVFDDEGRIVRCEFEGLKSHYDYTASYIPNASTGLSRLPEKRVYMANFEKLIRSLDEC
ncbi:DNA-(apurinic or apyrimidinic site) lyase, partial [Nowakowskiella sp. JEL0078]